MNRYYPIMSVLKDLKWHEKPEFCRPYSQDDRRLREMAARGWIEYEKKIDRQDGRVLRTFYRIIEIHPAWYEYSGQRRVQQDLFV